MRIGDYTIYSQFINGRQKVSVNFIDRQNGVVLYDTTPQFTDNFWKTITEHIRAIEKAREDEMMGKNL